MSLSNLSYRSNASSYLIESSLLSSDDYTRSWYSLPAVTRIYEIDPLRDSRWGEFVQSHPRASVFHSPGWLQALHSAYGYEPAALTTAGPREQLSSALVFCRIKSWLTGTRVVSLPFSDHCEPLIERQDDLDAMLGHLQRIMNDEHEDYIEVRPIALKPNVASGFAPSCAYFSHVLDLSGSSEALFRGFHKDCVQRKIKRAERELLTYESGNSEDLLGKFYRLLVTTRRRQHLPPQPRSWFRHLSRAFGNKLQVRLAYHRGRPVASILTIKYGSTVTYKYGASDVRYSNLGGTALLFWKTIQEAQQEGMTQFDLGRSDVDNEGLIKFKEHWGAQRAVLEYWRFPDRQRSTRSDWSKKVNRRLATIAPEWCLIAAGKLLYRHIGKPICAKNESTRLIPD